ncbi:MAG: hypothetical protein ACK518_02495 [bacterium]
MTYSVSYCGHRDLHWRPRRGPLRAPDDVDEALRRADPFSQVEAETEIYNAAGHFPHS